MEIWRTHDWRSSLEKGGILDLEVEALFKPARKMKIPGLSFSVVLFTFQITLFILYGVLAEYEKYDPAENGISSYYPGELLAGINALSSE